MAINCCRVLQLHLILLVHVYVAFIICFGQSQDLSTLIGGIKSAIFIDFEITQFLQKNVATIEEPSTRKVVVNYLKEAELLNRMPENGLANTSVEYMLKLIKERSKDPLNCFQTARRLTVDLTKLAILLPEHKAFQTLINDRADEYGVATFKDDVASTALTILRLQTTYKITAEQLTRGEIKHVMSPIRLTVADCVILGQTARDNQLYYFYLEWIEESHNLCLRSNTSGGCRDLTDSLLFTAINEFDEQLKGNKAVGIISAGAALGDETKTIRYTRKRKQQWQDSIKATPEQLLCNDGSQLDTETQSQLNCFYLERATDPSLALHRYGVEQLSVEPELVMIHEFINKEVANSLMLLAQPQLDWSRIASERNETHGVIDTNSRISKQAWFYDIDDQRVEKMSLRIQRITGLSLIDADGLQVVNYGTGGHYRSHHDYFQSVGFDAETRLELKPAGDRIATFIIYLNDVELGGYTAFPMAKATVHPKAGSAAFWYNLDNSLNVDDFTLHAGCPILYGEKWIANKWFREHSQMFLKPCRGKESDRNNKRKLTD